MVDLTPHEQKIVQAMKDIVATADDKVRSADAITEKSNLPKGLATSAITSLVNKKVLKRVAREKAAGYFVLPGF